MIAARAVGALVVALSLLACAVHLSNSGQSNVPRQPKGTVRVATLNVHYIRLRDAEGPWSVGDWEVRRGPLAAAFEVAAADVFAFQEMESFAGGDDGSVNLARDWLLARNPAYAAAASGDWREFPSTQPIFYRPDRLRVMDQGWFFFSDTPDVIYSRTFDGSWPAFASWARFAPVAGGAAFRVVNVHFEYRSGSNRTRSAALVAERVRPWVEAGEPVILAGDLNARAGSETVGILEGAGLVFAPVEGATYHFDRGINLFGAIDHLAATEGVVPVGEPVVLRWKFAGEWPTDHYPVFGDFRLPE
jgi:endonuclease/exonuclease/phosphatase family metal-dependent hydrolase